MKCPKSFDGTQATLDEYRNEPLTDKTSGKEVYLGYKSSFEESCGSCGYTTVDGKYLYGYNYAWNAKVGTREFWEDKDKGWKETPRWFRNCRSPYARRSWWGRFSSGACEIPEDYKFLGETCENEGQCKNGATRGYVDAVCGATDGTCVFAEDAEREGDAPDKMALFNFGKGACSNCRNDPRSPCGAYGGKNPFEVDTSVAAAGGGLLAIAAVAVVGGAWQMGKKRRRAGTEARNRKMVQMKENTGTV